MRANQDHKRKREQCKSECGRGAVRQGFCWSCYEQLVAQGLLRPKIGRGSQPDFCTVEGCGRPCFARNFCQTHYRHFMDHGDPLKQLKKTPGTGGTANGYEVLTIGGKKIRKHRRVMSEHLARDLGRWEFVHHKDGDPLNNSLDNLEIMTPAEHTREHRNRDRQLRLLSINWATKCSVEGCPNPRLCRGLCKRHHREYLASGIIPRLLAKSMKDKICIVDGCGRNCLARDLCRRHYLRQYKRTATESWGDLEVRECTHPPGSPDGIQAPTDPRRSES
jgi:HNH endonuclease